MKSDEAHSFIFESPDARTADKLMIIIHGSGVVRAGQWSRRLVKALAYPVVFCILIISSHAHQVDHQRLFKQWNPITIYQTFCRGTTYKQRMQFEPKII